MAGRVFAVGSIRIALGIMVVSCVACTGASGRPPENPSATATVRASTSTSTPSVAMFKSHVPIPEKDGRSLPFWLVDVTVRQDDRAVGEAVALVDTGAQTTVIDRAWAAAHGLRSAETHVVATDIAGQRIATWVAGDVQLSLGAIDGRASDLVLIDMPEMLRGLGIAVIWSPQSTVAPASLLRFDFRQGRIEGGEAGELAEPRRPSCRGRRFDSSALVVDATVGGHSMQLELDSGSNDTSLLQGSAAGAALWTQSLGGQTTSHGAAGGFASRELGLVPVEVEGYAMLTSVSVIGTDAGADAPAPECPSDGVIGLPVLERCRLALTQTHFSLACE